MPQDLGGVLHGSPIPGAIRRQPPDNVAELVKQDGDLRFRSVPVEICDGQHTIAASPVDLRPGVSLYHRRTTVEEWPVGVQPDHGVPTGVLYRPRSPRMFEKKLALRISHAVDARRSVTFQLEVQ